MNIERPTKEIVTPVQNKKVVLKEWITGREQEYIQEPIMSAASFKAGLMAGNPTAEMTDFKNSAITESNHRTIETMVVSVDGVVEKVLDSVLEMHKDDTDFVVEEINKLLKKK